MWFLFFEFRIVVLCLDQETEAKGQGKPKSKKKTSQKKSEVLLLCHPPFCSRLRMLLHVLGEGRHRAKELPMFKDATEEAHETERE
jgi:hypothetical protein